MSFTSAGGFRLAIRQSARIPRAYLSTGLLDPVVTSIELAELATSSTRSIRPSRSSTASEDTVIEDFAFQIGFPEILLGLAALALIAVGIWKVASLLWAAFSG